MDTVSPSETATSGQVATTSSTPITAAPPTLNANEEPRVEVSIVGSPEVFGAQEAVTVTKSSGSPDSHEERLIERCDVAASPSDPRPPKKRYGSSDAGSVEVPPAESPSGAQLPRAAPPPSAFCDARQVPTGEQFLQLLYNWQWVDIDNTQLPSVMRGGERFLAVHMVQLKLLSKFPPAIPAEIISRFTMVSHKMSTVEAWQFNAINAIKRKFDLGCQLFSTQDEVVRLNDVQMFYWNVKALNLSRIIQQYDAELQNTNGNLTLIATIQSLKNHVEADLERVRKELRALTEPHQTSQPSQTSAAAAHQSAGQSASNDQGGVDELSEKQLTPEVLQILMTFLRKNGLSETEEALSKEANNLLVMGEDASAAANFPSSEALLSEFDSLIQFVDSSFDFFQAEFSLMLYPVFAHSYIKLLMENSVNNAREFFKRYCKRIPTPYEELVYKLERIQSAHQAQADTYVQLLIKNPFLVKMSKSSIKQLEIPLARTPTIKNIVKEHITIEASDVISKLRSSVESQMGGILGQVSKNEKRHKMYYGVLKDDVSQTIEKKKTRGKDLKDNKKSQALAPVPDRIPLPPLSEALREERRKAMRDAAKLTLVSQESPPSVCMLTALNAYGLVSSCDISDDSSILCIGSSDGSIELTAFDEEQKLKKLRDMDALERIDTDADNVSDLLYDEANAKSEVTLHGHSGVVYSVHFSPDNRLLASSSLDCTIRLWSLETQKNVVVYRLSRPVWQVQFSNRGYYMCSGGEDNTAMLWCTERMYPLRIFPDCYGSVNCVDFHPNCNYVVGGSCDRYVRVWDVLTGTCVRTFSGHSAAVTAVKVSPCGRYIISTGADGAVCVWDVAYQRLAGMETRDFKGSMGSICFSRDGGSFAVSQGGESLSVYSLDNMIAATSGVSSNNELCFDPKINMPNFNIFTYPTLQTAVIGLHFTRRNLLLAVGAYNS